MGEKTKKYFSFWKSYWGKHFIFWMIIFLIFISIFSFIQISSSNIYARLLIIGVLIFYFLFGMYFSISSFGMAKRLFTKIINLNNYSYREVTDERKIPALLVVLPVYLIIFQTYFLIAGYSFIEALIFGWLVLLFVRSSHYVDPLLGADIGKIIGSFFIPFGFIIVLIKGSSFYVDLSTGNIFIKEYLAYFLYFITFILATIPLEVLMDYRGKNKHISDKEKRKKREWEKDPCFVKYKKK